MGGADNHGRLVYVMGPSGSGKDSLIDYVRERLDPSGDDRIFIARRYITRPPESTGESHAALSIPCFEARQRSGDFALSWFANGLGYGIGREIDDSLRAGRHVIVNGSRAHFPQAIERYPTLLPILVSVDPAVLRERLLARGREDAADITARLLRSGDLPVAHSALHVIHNDGPISVAGEAFLGMIRHIPSLHQASSRALTL